MLSYSGRQKCKGSRPSQAIDPRYLCDGEYDCIDRSDESNCGKDDRDSFIAKQCTFLKERGESPRERWEFEVMT